MKRTILKKKRLSLKSKKENGADQERPLLPEVFWKGKTTRHQIVYVDLMDEENYPVALQVGQLINDLQHDITRLKKQIKKLNKTPIEHLTETTQLKVEYFDRKRVELRNCLD